MYGSAVKRIGGKSKRREDGGVELLLPFLWDRCSRTDRLHFQEIKIILIKRIYGISQNPCAYI